MVIYDLIFDVLKKNGIDVYAPNTHIGECIKPYVVVKESTGAKYNNYSTQIIYYDVLCYAKNYSDCIVLKNEVKRIMRQAEYSVIPTFNETEAFYDEIIKGYMTSVEYRNYRKIN